MFALERRPRPFLGYLRMELEHFPLQALPIDAGDFCALLETIASTAAIASQQALLQRVAELFRQHGFAHVLDQWDELAWILNYDPGPETL